MLPKAITDAVYNCIKCGLCLAACPVYGELREEAVAPRGHVQHLRAVLEGRLELSSHLRETTFLCLFCQACVAACPSGISLGGLFAGIRAEMVGRYGIPLEKRLIFRMLDTLPQVPAWARALNGFLQDSIPLGLKVKGISMGSLPPLARRPLTQLLPERISPDGIRARVIYFPGCLDDHIYPETGRAVSEVLNALKVEVILPRNFQCCGIPMYAAGDPGLALDKVKHNLRILANIEAEAILTTCSSCGLMLRREYAMLISEMGGDPTEAFQVGAKVRDISEFLVERGGLNGRLKPLPFRATYHDPCHLAKGLGIRREPRELLRAIPGLEFIEMPDAEACCGSGGAFMFEHPGIADRIASKKARGILATDAEVVATGCPACRMQLASHLCRAGSKVEVVHTVQLLERALKGEGDKFVAKSGDLV